MNHVELCLELKSSAYIREFQMAIILKLLVDMVAFCSLAPVFLVSEVRGKLMLRMGIGIVIVAV